MRTEKCALELESGHHWHWHCRCVGCCVSRPAKPCPMNCKRILIATDFSECSGAALEFASRLARENGATLYIVHVDAIVDVSPVAVPRSEEVTSMTPRGAMNTAK